MRVAVSGSSGLIGRALCSALEVRGDDVVPLVRPSSGAGRPGIPWNPAEHTLDPAAFEGVDAVVHLAGENIAAGLWTRSRKARIRNSRIDGTALIAKALAESVGGPNVLVSGSAVGFYGDRGDELLTESSVPGQGFLAETSVAWEGACLPAAEAGVRVVLARTGLVLAGRGGVLGPMVPAFKLGLGAVLGNGRQYMSWITLLDEVRALLFCLDNPSMTGPVNVVGPHAVTNEVFTRTLAAALHRPAFLPAPAALLRLGLGTMAEELLLASQRVEPAALTRAGFQFTHRELRPALETVLADR